VRDRFNGLAFSYLFTTFVVYQRSLSRF